FATHYFELTSLSDELATVKNVHLTAVESRNKITFLYQVQEGPASQSYGLQVASLAGVPQAVIARAKSKLRELETELVKHHEGIQLSIFDSPADTKNEKDIERASKLEEELSALDPDRMTAREALDIIYRWKEELKD
ncbi:MAG: DNA mismatch repair protein MutS, partial [Gammaproteobacteria bacterium]|nr:DNA mismatch repair protein MutS [Gammaproteobacteria bacterium]